MIARRDVPLWWLVLRIKLKLWRYLATRAALRLVRRAIDWRGIGRLTKSGGSSCAT